MPRKSQSQKWLELGETFKGKTKSEKKIEKILNPPAPSSPPQSQILAGYSGASSSFPALKRSKKKSSSKPSSIENLIPILLPEKLIISAKQKLQTERGIDLEKFIQIYLRMILRASKSILGLKDELGFGKYSGEIVEDVARIDPSYLAWLITQDGRTKFEPEVLILVDEMLKK